METPPQIEGETITRQHHSLYAAVGRPNAFMLPTNYICIQSLSKYYYYFVSYCQSRPHMIRNRNAMQVHLICLNKRYFLLNKYTKVGYAVMLACHSRLISYESSIKSICLSFQLMYIRLCCRHDWLQQGSNTYVLIPS
jgi:hypothetical protein